MTAKIMSSVTALKLHAKNKSKMITHAMISGKTWLAVITMTIARTAMTQRTQAYNAHPTGIYTAIQQQTL